MEEIPRGNAPVTFFWFVRHIIAALLVNGTGVEEMLVQMVDEFEHVALHGARHGDIIDKTGDNVRVSVWMNAQKRSL